MADSAENLVRAFERNHSAVVALIGEPTFDINALNQLIASRGQLIAEIVDAGLDDDVLSALARRHAALERAIEHARTDMGDRLSKMNAGKRALQAYRNP